MRGQYKGGFALIKSLLNSKQAAISSYIVEISEESASAEELSSQAEVLKDTVGLFRLK